MTAGAYDIATEHAILAEASAAGDLRAVPAVLLFGVLLGALYDIFRMISAALGLRGDCGADDGRIHGLLLRLQQYRCRPIRCREQVRSDYVQTASGKRIRIPAQILQGVLDILYFLITGILGAVFLYWRNNGILRWYLILCGGIGFLLYSRSLGRVVLPVFLLCTALLRAGMCALYNVILYYPLRIVYRAMTAIFCCAAKVYRTAWQRLCQKRKQREPSLKDNEKRRGLLWQKRKNSQRKKRAFLRKRHFLFSSSSVLSQSSSFTDRLSSTKKKLP